MIRRDNRMTVKDIIDLVRGLSGELVMKRYPIIVLVSFLNEALRKVCSELYIYKETSTLSTEADKQGYDIPNYVVKVISVTIDNKERTDYIVYGNKIEFKDKIADGTDNLVITYYSAPQYTVQYYDLPDNEEPGWIVGFSKVGEPATAHIPEIDIPAMYYDLLINYMLYMIYLNENQQDKAVAKLSIFNSALQQAIAIENSRYSKDVRFWI